MPGYRSRVLAMEYFIEQECKEYYLKQHQRKMKIVFEKINYGEFMFYVLNWEKERVQKQHHQRKMKIVFEKLKF